MIACGAWGSCNPYIFDYDDDGNSYLIFDRDQGTAEISENLCAGLEVSVQGCPTNWIK
jgi:ferredoxin